MPGCYIAIDRSDRRKLHAFLAMPEKQSGPGLIVLHDAHGHNTQLRATAEHFAEEGYVVLAPDFYGRDPSDSELGYDEAATIVARGLAHAIDVPRALDDIAAAMEALRARPECGAKIGVLGFSLGGGLAQMAGASLPIDCAVSYYGWTFDRKAALAKCPMALHFASADRLVRPHPEIWTASAGGDETEIYFYPGAQHGFACPDQPTFDKLAAQMAQSRTISLLRRVLGPHYDLSALWEKHRDCEFVSRDTAATMRTMVAQPYVNHIPTMTGGVGFAELSHFYEHHFIPKNPGDARSIPISRTIGGDRVVNESLFCFTHDVEIDWMLPGIKPTGKYVEVPLVSVICFRGDKLYHEHIYWDQASVLVQIGLLDPTDLPVAGKEAGRKLIDESLPSNALLLRQRPSTDEPA